MYSLNYFVYKRSPGSACKCSESKTNLVVKPYTEKKGLLIPLYDGFYDYNSNQFTQDFYNMLKLATRFISTVETFVIINPDSGPGDESLKDLYTQTINLLQSFGCIVIGYVSTQYGQRSIDDVKSDIDQWVNLYPDIDGFFLDEFPDTYSDDLFNYYQTISSYIHKKKKSFVIVVNPGSVTDRQWFDKNGLFDIANIWEDSQYPTETDLSGNGYDTVDSYRKSILVYGQSLDRDKIILAKDYVKLLYVTSVSSDPWNSISPYLEDLYKIITNDFTVDNQAISNITTFSSNKIEDINALRQQSITYAINLAQRESYTSYTIYEPSDLDESKVETGFIRLKSQESLLIEIPLKDPTKARYIQELAFTLYPMSDKFKLQFSFDQTRYINYDPETKIENHNADKLCIKITNVSDLDAYFYGLIVVYKY